MASVISHFAVGAAVALPFASLEVVRPSIKPLGLVVAAGLVAMAPDLDTLFFGVIPYGHFYGHRGFFHSPLFGLVLGAVLATFAYLTSRSVDSASCLPVAAALGLAGATHGLLDAMTDGGLGVMLLYPFSEQRQFLPWRPLVAPPIELSRITLEDVTRLASSEWPVLAASGVWAGATTALVKARQRKRNAGLRQVLNEFNGEMDLRAQAELWKGMAEAGPGGEHPGTGDRDSPDSGMPPRTGR